MESSEIRDYGKVVSRLVLFDEAAHEEIEKFVELGGKRFVLSESHTRRRLAARISLQLSVSPEAELESAKNASIRRALRHSYGKDLKEGLFGSLRQL